MRRGPAALLMITPDSEKTLEHLAFVLSAVGVLALALRHYIADFRTTHGHRTPPGPDAGGRKITRGRTRL